VEATLCRKARAASRGVCVCVGSVCVCVCVCVGRSEPPAGVCVYSSGGPGETDLAHHWNPHIPLDREDTAYPGVSTGWGRPESGPSRRDGY
jgi:hypothetical protein